MYEEFHGSVVFIVDEITAEAEASKAFETFAEMAFGEGCGFGDLGDANVVFQSLFQECIDAIDQFVPSTLVRRGGDEFACAAERVGSQLVEKTGGGEGEHVERRFVERLADGVLASDVQGFVAQGCIQRDWRIGEGVEGFCVSRFESEEKPAHFVLGDFHVEMELVRFD